MPGTAQRARSTVYVMCALVSKRCEICSSLQKVTQLRSQDRANACGRDCCCVPPRAITITLYMCSAWDRPSRRPRSAIVRAGALRGHKRLPCGRSCDTVGRRVAGRRRGIPHPRAHFAAAVRAFEGRCAPQMERRGAGLTSLAVCRDTSLADGHGVAEQGGSPTSARVHRRWLTSEDFLGQPTGLPQALSCITLARMDSTKWKGDLVACRLPTATRPLARRRSATGKIESLCVGRARAAPGGAGIRFEGGASPGWGVMAPVAGSGRRWAGGVVMSRAGLSGGRPRAAYERFSIAACGALQTAVVQSAISGPVCALLRWVVGDTSAPLTMLTLVTSLP